MRVIYSITRMGYTWSHPDDSGVRRGGLMAVLYEQVPALTAKYQGLLKATEDNIRRILQADAVPEGILSDRSRLLLASHACMCARRRSFSVLKLPGHSMQATVAMMRSSFFTFQGRERATATSKSASRPGRGKAKLGGARVMKGRTFSVTFPVRE